MKINRFSVIAAIAAIYLAASVWHGAAFPAGVVGISHAHAAIHGEGWLWLLRLGSLAGCFVMWCGKVLLTIVVQLLCHLARVAIFVYLFGR
jgi:fructose-specific phosphotransferase system IIC component